MMAKTTLGDEESLRAKIGQPMGNASRVVSQRVVFALPCHRRGNPSPFAML